MPLLLQELLVESADRFPERVAVRCRNESITYRQLEEMSAKFAQQMTSRGVSPGDRVGIFLAKSIESVVAMFAALRAGAVYVPIDPLMPNNRARYIIENCGIQHLAISTKKFQQLFEDRPPERDFTCYLMDADDSASSRDRVTFIGRVQIFSSRPIETPCDRDGSDLAYILYTSGSTGDPKGVAISHRAALTFINWAYSEFSITEEDILANVAPLHFDLSVFDIYAAIKGGAEVVLVPQEYTTFPVMLTRLINDYGITVWYSVPSALILMLTKGGFAGSDHSTLRLILFAGEVFPTKYLQQLKNSTQARLCNLYGPTETNVCTYYDATYISDSQTAPIPIGRPVADYYIVVLDDSGQIVPEGGEGELCAGGPGLMSGYWADPEKTRRQLISAPGEPEQGMILYRTGDIVRKDDAGDLHYISRRDNMIKSRGYRIELGEIEAALYAHSEVREAAVIAIPDETITNRVVAYVVSSKSTLSEEHLLQHCLEHIPKYMIPEKIHFRSELPKTSTGKIDKRAIR